MMQRHHGDHIQYSRNQIDHYDDIKRRGEWRSGDNNNNDNDEKRKSVVESHSRVSITPSSTFDSLLFFLIQQKHDFLFLKKCKSHIRQLKRKKKSQIQLRCVVVYKFVT